MRSPRSRAGRSGLALGAIGLLVAGLLPSSAASGADAPFRNGTAQASAIVTRVTPGVGSLPTGVAAGVALTNVTNSVAQAQSQTLDFGIVGLLLAALGVPASAMPPPTAVDNRHGDASTSVVRNPVGAATAGEGVEEARATKQPSAAATTTLARGFGDLVTVSAGRADASSEVLPGHARIARASVSVDVDIAGVVTLTGLRWDATHRTGDEASSSGHFSLAAASVEGVALPVGSLRQVQDAVNAALAPSGILVELPEVQRAPGSLGAIEVTPLQVELKDTPIGKAVAGPLLGATRAARAQLFDELVRAYAPTENLLLAGDVLTSILTGSGFLAISVGGVQAGSGTLPLPPPTPSAVRPSTTVAGGGATTIGPLPVTGGPVTPAVTAGGRPARPTATTYRCRSSHALHPNRCSGGRLLLGGSLGLAAVVLLGLLERRRTGHRARLRTYVPLLGASLAVIVLGAAVGVPRARIALPVVPRRPPGPAVAAVDASGAPVAGPVASTPSVATPTGGARRGTVGRCTDRTAQVVGDPYSPPCFSFHGDNGGATSIGVTRDTITVTVRSVAYGSAVDIFRSLSGEQLATSPASEEETLQALADYFSDHFQMYGRRLKIQYYNGTGNGVVELLGGGVEQAAADAITASKELHAFADVSAITLPYSNALSQDHVVNFGAPYPSRAWFEARRPYAWSLFPDGTNVVAATTSAIIGRYPPGSVAQWAGPGTKGQPRRFGIIAPENGEYQESINILLDKLKAAGIPVATNQKYRLDLASFPNQASNVIAQMKDAGVTSVLCLCDPAMLAFGLAPKADEQSYYPEWITAGLVFVDQDVVAQTVATDQWQHAFGTAYNAESEPIGGSFPYFAYKSERPDDEPAPGVEELYYQMLQLAIGVQMAGPDLTPETFEQGMFAYPPAFGPRGTWDYGPGDRTPANDYREIWWDPNRISGQDGKPGAWAQLNGGRRYTPEHPPHGTAPFFVQG